MRRFLQFIQRTVIVIDLINDVISRRGAGIVATSVRNKWDLLLKMLWFPEDTIGKGRRRGWRRGFALGSSSDG